MYLRGLGDLQTSWSACVNAGGVPRNITQGGYTDYATGRQVPATQVYAGCTFPPAGSGGGGGASNITISVPTNTQVSPQISPQFIQQQQPTNSPIGVTGAKDTTGITDDYLAKAAEEESQRMQMILDALKNLQQPASSPVVVPQTTQSADDARAASTSGFSLGAIPALPLVLVIAAGAGIVYAATRKHSTNAKRRRR